jgi:ABC-2 type transport system ATP-binding protein
VAARLTFEGLTKCFGPVSAVTGLTATVGPGGVTAFLGPNGAGKTTTLRMLLGLVRPTTGSATIDGRRYEELSEPTRQVGVLLEASSSFHPGRRAIDHLRVIATAAGLQKEAPERALAAVSMSGAADRKVGGFSLGMRQRLGLAAALLGDPGVLVLDEPANGLDPQGIRWLRDALRTLAGEGRTVLLSSHDLSEVEQIADHVLVLARGRAVWQGSLGELKERSISTTVTSPQIECLTRLLAASGNRAEVVARDRATTSASPATVGAIAARHRIVLHRLVEQAPALEEVFLDLTDGRR